MLQYGGKIGVYLMVAMAKKYSHTASWTREMTALALFAVGFALYDAREGGEYARIAALLMMLGAGAFMCFAIVERIFFLPRIMRPENRANSPELVQDPHTPRHSEVNYDGPRIPRTQPQTDASLGPDGLDPVAPPQHAYQPPPPPTPPPPTHPTSPTPPPSAHARAEHDPESDHEHPDEDEHDAHQRQAEMESTLSDPFFGGGSGGSGGKK